MTPTFESVLIKSRTVTIQMTGSKSPFLLSVLLIRTLPSCVLSEFVGILFHFTLQGSSNISVCGIDEILKCDHSDESY